MEAFAHTPTSGPGWLRVVASKDSDSPAIMEIRGVIGESFWGDGTSEKAFCDALNQIPRDRQIRVLINSEGGAVQDGLGIYHALLERKAKVTTVCVGYAMSMASVVLQAGARRIVSRSSVSMIHKPWTFAQGNADEMRKTAEFLDKTETALIEAYKRSGQSEKEIAKALEAETYMTGEEAVEWGLADEVSEEEADTSGWKPDQAQARRIPAHILNMISPGQPGDSNNPRTDTVNKKAILALLLEHGVKVADDAKDEALLAELKKLVDGHKVTPAKAAELTAAVTPDAERNARASQQEAAAGVVTRAEFDNLRASNARLQEERDRERRARHEQTVDAAVSSYRLNVNERADFISLFDRDEEMASRLLAARPEAPPGVAPVVREVAADILNIGQELTRIRAPIVSWRRGNNVSAAELGQGGRACFQLAEANWPKLMAHWSRTCMAVSTNTIDADLQRTVILATVMRAFRRKLIPLSVFSTVFSNVPLRIEGGTAKVAVPYYPLQTTASTDFVAANGYDTEVNTNDGAKDVTLDKRKYQKFSYSSETLARQPYFNAAMHMTLCGEQLAVDVWSDVLSLVTLANFGAAVSTTTSGAFDYDDIADLSGDADDLHWPDAGRTLVVHTAYKTNLIKDDRVVRVDASGSPEALREAKVSEIAGFRFYPNTLVPPNGESLVGFIAMPSALLVATAPIEPAPGVRNLLVSYELMVDPDTGIGFSFRHGGDDILDRDYQIIECAYGRAVGETDALRRITSA